MGVAVGGRSRYISVAPTDADRGIPSLQSKASQAVSPLRRPKSFQLQRLELVVELHMTKNPPNHLVHSPESRYIICLSYFYLDYFFDFSNNKTGNNFSCVLI